VSTQARPNLPFTQHRVEYAFSEVLNGLFCRDITVCVPRNQSTIECLVRLLTLEAADVLEQRIWKKMVVLAALEVNTASWSPVRKV
jgi:hypothetical protein